MNYLKTTTHKVIIISLLACLPFLCRAQSSRTLWEDNLKKALVSGDTSSIKSFFSDDFGKKEMESWKYELAGGYLHFSESKLISMDTNAVLIYIPTDNNPYDGDNHNEYFGFIYRIYSIEKNSDSFFLSGRAMDMYKPDFTEYDLMVDADTGNGTFLFTCDISLTTANPHLFLKLAKDFEIDEFSINGTKAVYDRFGYFVCCNTGTAGMQHLHIQGKLKSPHTNNQFISMDDSSFFIRLGGFAAVPSPPPGNDGRCLFSGDSTHFRITYTYPDGYTLLQYGDSTETTLLNGKRQTRASLSGQWMDDIAFYACKGWEKKEITHGSTRIGFYFNDDDEKERNLVIAEVDSIMQWINTRFNNYGSLSINFVVLGSFVRGGLLNDSHSIISQSAEGLEGVIEYLHEICHMAPQPAVEGNYLWIKEGLTNFLSFEYLFSHKGEVRIWEDMKRKYLHYFDMYEEPLVNIRSTAIPTYWAAYSKAPWVFRMLEAEVGEECFRQGLYALGAMDDTILADSRSFIEVFEKVSGKDLTAFEEQWLCRRENPVLAVQGQLERRGDNSMVKITVTQNEPFFSLPLEVEIKTKNETIRKTIRVQGRETTFEMPVTGDELSVRYDPDARLFAVIKENKKTFTDDFTIPADTATYISGDGGRRIKVWFTTAKNRIVIVKREDDNESLLELTCRLSPVCYTVNGDTIFVLDAGAQTIEFENGRYDIAEPVYPEEFVPFLLSAAGWNNTGRLSVLYLIDGRMRCRVTHCILEQKTDGGYEFSTEDFLSGTRVSITSCGHFPVSFIAPDDTVFAREGY